MNLRDLPLVRPHLRKPAILDSNLLLLNWCASFDETLVGSFKRLSGFSADDVPLLSEVLELFSSVSTTPHVLTEVSNLTNSLPGWVKDDWFEFFAEKVRLIPEDYLPSSEIASDVVAIRFGLTDAALTRLAASYVILTIDWPLTNSLESRGLSVINFNHVREAVWDS